MGGNQDDPAPHRLHQLQSLHELIGVEMEVREYDAAASVHHGEPGRSPRAVVLHEGGKRRAGRWLVLTERDRKRILELVHAQLLEGVLIRSFEDGLDHREAHALGAQCTMQPL